MSQIVSLSNNIFDRSIYTKKEFQEVVSHFIVTTSLLDINNKDITVDSNTIRIMRDFGILESSNNKDLDNIKGILEEDLFLSLISSVNSLKNINIDLYPDIYKYSYKKRLELNQAEKKSGKPTLVDLFCGAGGLSLGLSQAGFRIIFANDIEKSALRTYAFNHPEVDANYITMGGIEDISYNIHNYIDEPVDVLVGGPPCQGFSMANRQRIIDDPRNVLYKYYVESVANLSPKVFIMENVKGMQKVADQVIEDFNSHQGVQYKISYQVLNAKKMGIPQNRERLIYIGIRNDIDIDPTTIFSEIESNKFEEISLWDSIKDLKEVSASRIKHSTVGDEKSGFIIDRNEEKVVNNYIRRINLGRKDIKLCFNHKARYNNDRDIEIYGRMLPGDNSESPRISDIMPYKSRKHIFKDKYFKLLPNKPCKTITAHMKFDCNMYIHPFQARGLTPREAARIQSYPDDYFFLGAYTKTYQQIGNSVPPLMAREIGKQLKKLMDDD